MQDSAWRLLVFADEMKELKQGCEPNVLGNRAGFRLEYGRRYGGEGIRRGGPSEEMSFGWCRIGNVRSGRDRKGNLK
jgi:hypothetical protein